MDSNWIGPIEPIFTMGDLSDIEFFAVNTDIAIGELFSDLPRGAPCPDCGHPHPDHEQMFVFTFITDTEKKIKVGIPLHSPLGLALRDGTIRRMVEGLVRAAQSTEN